MGKVFVMIIVNSKYKSKDEQEYKLRVAETAIKQISKKLVENHQSLSSHWVELFLSVKTGRLS